jgi:hypothetical protein
MIRGLVPPTITHGRPGFVLSDRPQHEYDQRPALKGCVQVSTLSALVDLINAGVNGAAGDLMIRVHDHTKVLLETLDCDEYGRRTAHACVELAKTDGFKFGQWHDQESFLISVMANFTEQGDREFLLRIASSLTSGAITTSDDDGITQTVTLKKGAALKTTEALRQRVTLAPFRTFREVSQPASEFIFRVHQVEDETPTLALFEADGGKWRIDAALAVRDWLKNKAGSIPVIA